MHRFYIVQLKKFNYIVIYYKNDDTGLLVCDTWKVQFYDEHTFIT